MQKLLKMLFGTFTEKTKKVLKEKKEEEEALKKETKGHERNGACSCIDAVKIQINHYRKICLHFLIILKNECHEIIRIC